MSRSIKLWSVLITWQHTVIIITCMFGLSVGVEVGRPSVTIHPPVVTVKHGQRAEFRCTATGNPTPTVEWTGELNSSLITGFNMSID